MVQSLGFAIYRALDWGLDENEERELSPRLEQLIDLMTNSDSEDSGCGTADEGYGGQEEEEEGGEGPPRSVRTFGQAMRCCAARLADPAEAPAHYQAVCRALFAETVELKAFLAKIRDAKEVSEGARPGKPPKMSGRAQRSPLPAPTRAAGAGHGPSPGAPPAPASHVLVLAGTARSGDGAALGTQLGAAVSSGPPVPLGQGDGVWCRGRCCRS